MNQIGYLQQPQPRARHMETHYQYTGANRMLSPPECQYLIGYALTLGFGSAAIGNPAHSRVDESYRCAQVAILPFASPIAWLYERLNDRTQAVNDGDYHFDLAGLLEPLQLIRYDAPLLPGDEAGHYDWHQDFGADYMSRRKLSICAQLSSPADYEGGRLTIMDPGPKPLGGIYLEQGAAVVFPSWMPHCVTPLTRGTRYSLVAWVHGSPFR